MSSSTPRASRHIVQNEDLLFEVSSPGKRGYQLPALDVPAVTLAAARREIPDCPEVSELEVIRHFTRLSTWNYGVDTGIYPLGSCTMKYNARVNEAVTRLEGLGDGHPLQPEELSQGALRIMQLLSEYLLEITGMDAITLQPAAGAQGELTGILLVRAALTARGDARKKVLIPDSAHGTNPATAAIAGYTVENLKSNPDGTVDMASLDRQMTRDVAALMLTNPNTLGIFEEDIHRIADLVHERGGMLYMDGANMNALVGRSRPGDFGVDVMHLNLHKTFSTPHGGGGPGSGPVAVKKTLEPYLPIPVLRVKRGKPVLDYRRPKSIGRVRAFYGNFGMFTRALAYIMANGSDGLKQTTEDAVLNANYIRRKLQDVFALPYPTPSMHEVVFSDSIQAAQGVHTGDIAKRLIDYGFHPYTVSFPLVVRGAMMIEPTESANQREMDEFIAALRAIAEESKNTPELVTGAPHTTKISRLDEVAAARNPVLRWRPSKSEAAQS